MERANGFDRARARGRALLLAALLPLPGIAPAGSGALDFGARRHVAEPKLTLSNEPELCASSSRVQRRSSIRRMRSRSGGGQVRPSLHRAGPRCRMASVSRGTLSAAWISISMEPDTSRC